MERCLSGRKGLTANELSGSNRTAGSNPALSAEKIIHTNGLFLFAKNFYIRYAEVACNF